MVLCTYICLQTLLTYSTVLFLELNMTQILHINKYKTIDYINFDKQHLLLVCPAGYFGQNCSMECRDTCTGCNNENGLCDRGCHPGWKGNHCDERNWFKYVLRCIL